MPLHGGGRKRAWPNATLPDLAHGVQFERDAAQSGTAYGRTQTMDDTAKRAQAARATCPYLTSKQTAFHLGIADSTLRALRAAGRAPVGRRHGRTWRYHIDDIEAWSVERSSGGGHD